MDVSVYTHTWTCVCEGTCVEVRVLTCLNVRERVCMPVRVCVCMRACCLSKLRLRENNFILLWVSCLCMCVCVCACMCICVRVRVCVCVCVWCVCERVCMV
jgi:hypothetical protein